MKSEPGWEREEAGQEKGFYEIIIYVMNKNIQNSPKGQTHKLMSYLVLSVVL